MELPQMTWFAIKIAQQQMQIIKYMALIILIAEIVQLNIHVQHGIAENGLNCNIYCPAPNAGNKIYDATNTNGGNCYVKYTCDYGIADNGLNCNIYCPAPNADNKIYNATNTGSGNCYVKYTCDYGIAENGLNCNQNCTIYYDFNQLFQNSVNGSCTAYQICDFGVNANHTNCNSFQL